MLGLSRAVEIWSNIFQKGEHTVYIPSESVEQHKKELEVFIGQELIYTPMPEHGIDIFKITCKNAVFPSFSESSLE